MPRVTLKTIAQEAGVSIATVSLALRGQGKLSKESISRIKEIAERLNYIPDPMLASLASKRFREGEYSQGQPLAILEFPIHEGNSEATAVYQKTLLDSATKFGYAPHVYSIDQMGKYQEFTRTLYHRGTQAVIITGQPDLRFFGNTDLWKSFSIVQCGRYRSTLPVHTVRPNIFQAIKLVFEKVHSRGYKCIGFALGHHPEILEDDQSRLGAALAMLEQFIPHKQQIPPYFEDLNDIPKIIAWGKKHRVDAYIAFNASLWYALKDAGIQCPRDAGFVCLHHHEPNDGCSTIAGLNQASDEIARQSVLLVDQMVRHNDCGLSQNPRQILIPSLWIEGTSLEPR